MTDSEIRLKLIDVRDLINHSEFADKLAGLLVDVDEKLSEINESNFEFSILNADNFTSSSTSYIQLLRNIKNHIVELDLLIDILRGI